MLVPIAVAHGPEIPNEPQIDKISLVSELLNAEKQQFTTASTIKVEPLDRSSYSATTAQEIETKHVEEARKKAEAELEEQRQSRLKNISPSFASFNASDNSCYNNFCWPVNHFSYSYENNGFQTSQRPNHNGFDMLTDQGTPIVAVTDGVVRISQESYGGYGVAVVVDSVIDGQRVSMTYGHMTYGTRVVAPGDTVKAGQLLGLVGSTGRSTANHLHLEIEVGGSLVDPYPWMINHAGPINNG